MTLNHLTVKQYLELLPIRAKIKAIEEALVDCPEADRFDLNLDLMEAKAEKLSVVFSKPVEYFQKMSFAKLHTSYAHALKIEAEAMNERVIDEITLNGTTYKPILDAADFDTCAYLSLQVYRKDVHANFADILTWIYLPVGTDQKDRPDDLKKWREDMLTAKMNEVSGAFFLFLKRCKRWKAAMPAYDLKMIEMLKIHAREVETWVKSQNTTDGVTPSS